MSFGSEPGCALSNTLIVWMLPCNCTRPNDNEAVRTARSMSHLWRTFGMLNLYARKASPLAPLPAILNGTPDVGPDEPYRLYAATCLAIGAVGEAAGGSSRSRLSNSALMATSAELPDMESAAIAGLSTNG